MMMFIGKILMVIGAAAMALCICDLAYLAFVLAPRSGVLSRDSFYCLDWAIYLVSGGFPVVMVGILMWGIGSNADEQRKADQP